MGVQGREDEGHKPTQLSLARKMWDTPRQKARSWLAEEGWCSRSQRKKVNKEEGDGGEDMLKNTASNSE